MLAPEDHAWYFDFQVTWLRGGVPSVEIARLQCLALLAQSRVLARLVSEPSSMFGPCGRWVLIVLTSLVVPGTTSIDAPTPINHKQTKPSCSIITFQGFLRETTRFAKNIQVSFEKFEKSFETCEDKIEISFLRDTQSDIPGLFRAWRIL